MKRDEGQATVEFALVLPLLVTLLLGLLQAVAFGVDSARVAGAAREAARAASVGRDAAGVKAAALRGGGGLDSSRVDVSAPALPRPAGEAVTVEVAYRTEFFVPVLARLGLDPPVVRSSVTMLSE